MFTYVCLVKQHKITINIKQPQSLRYTFNVHCFNQYFFCTFFIYIWFAYFEGLILLLASSIDYVRMLGPLYSLSTVKHNYINIDICIYFVFVICVFVVEGIYLFVSWFLAPLSTIFQPYCAWQSFLLVEETGGPRENHRSVASH